MMQRIWAEECKKGLVNDTKRMNRIFFMVVEDYFSNLLIYCIGAKVKLMSKNRQI